MGRLLGSVFPNAVLLIKRLCNIYIKRAEISAFINFEKSPVMHNLPTAFPMWKKANVACLSLITQVVRILRVNFLHALLGLSNWVYSFNLETFWIIFVSDTCRKILVKYWTCRLVQFSSHKKYVPWQVKDQIINSGGEKIRLCVCIFHAYCPRV